MNGFPLTISGKLSVARTRQGLVQDEQLSQNKTKKCTHSLQFKKVKAEFGPFKKAQYMIARPYESGQVHTLIYPKKGKLKLRRSKSLLASH